MVELFDKKVVISKGLEIKEGANGNRKGTLAAGILDAHNTSDDPKLMKIKFDALASHDITYVGIIQTARASGLEKFPIPYVLTNCHNSLCAVGGTINEDDHRFGLSAAEKYGGIFVPAHQAVIHQFNREILAGCGKMILGSDSHTRYGGLGTMAMGEGGPELVKQLLGRTYDVATPDVIAVYLEGAPKPGVGPMDVALAIIGKVFAPDFVKNKVMEFVGPGVAGLSVDYRNGIDVMTTETTCLSSIWSTDEKVKDWYELHGRPEEYKELTPAEDAEYDGLIKVDLSQIEPMIALPFHPSNVFTVREVAADPKPFLEAVEKYSVENLGYPKGALDLQSKVIDGKLQVDQASIVGCSGGTYENLIVAADIMKDKFIGSGSFTMSAYPSSQPVYAGLIEDGAIGELMKSGVVVRSAFCGPCFGAGDTPRNNGFSIRHATRNFPNRDGSKPGDGQSSAVALMDARSIAATAANGGVLTSATDVVTGAEPKGNYKYDGSIYDNRCYNGWGKAKPETELIYGPNIKDWPQMIGLTDNLLLNVASYITDPVTTTDELIPSGETSSYRSNPLRLAEFALGRKDPEYVGRAKEIHAMEKRRVKWLAGEAGKDEVAALMTYAKELYPAADEALLKSCSLGSLVYAVKPGDGSAREQAASVQKVLGGWANIAQDYATKRYRSNVINWGMLPFIVDEADAPKFTVNSTILVKDVREAVVSGAEEVKAQIVGGEEITLKLPNFTEGERKIVTEGCLINYYASENK
ncbi:MAG: hydratase [Spirochaetales bacterium]|nr:hydratase [Spirochaetales bacterium]